VILSGDTIFFAPSNEEWSHRRKSIAMAFYKEKLKKMSASI
jgi:cytochrome P450